MTKQQQPSKDQSSKSPPSKDLKGSSSNGGGGSASKHQDVKNKTEKPVSNNMHTTKMDPKGGKGGAK